MGLYLSNSIEAIFSLVFFNKTVIDQVRSIKDTYSHALIDNEKDIITTEPDSLEIYVIINRYMEENEEKRVFLNEHEESDQEAEFEQKISNWNVCRQVLLLNALAQMTYLLSKVKNF